MYRIYSGFASITAKTKLQLKLKLKQELNKISVLSKMKHDAWRNDVMKSLKLLLILTIVISLVAFSGCTDNVDDGDTIDTVETENRNDDRVEDIQPMPPEVEPNRPDDGEYLYGTAVVEQIEILILESFPVQVNVIAKGYLSDGCTEIGDITKVRDGNTFTVTVETIRPADAMCTEAIVPYEEVISLNVRDLKAGTYTVVVNSVRDSFELAMDNSIVD